MRVQNSLPVFLAAASAVVDAAPSSTPSKRGVDFNWGGTKVRGVNLGGWLVLEPFITPSIFESHSTPDYPVIDEWTLCEKLGKQGCYDTLKPHWDTFVSLQDFQKIRDSGFNVVRIPIGYWSYVEPWGPFTQGAAPYLDKAITWARETGLKVVIDLHGAPKSQNGFDHSGQKLANPGWGDADSLAYTHQTLKIINEKYAKPDMQDVVVAIQPVNEPFLAMVPQDTVSQFYRDAYYNLREISDTPITLHDGFFDPSWMNGFLTPQDNAQGVIVDHHQYQIFDAGLVAMGVEQHLGMACNAVNSYATSDKWTIVGEWSGALTDCAKHLNGFASGSRMEGSFAGASYIGSCSGKSGRVDSWSQDWKDSVRRYIEVQLDAFEARTQGWIFWNFKTEGSAGEWDLFQLLDGEVFPQPLGDRKFGKYCTNF
ncbi:glycoside hydrolase family 5 protein [Macroventuria anomochaeta]|uniref:Glycoside hydrolase family 5 protein n=1 Tax=Macroventuria anomochaeta TaxID=301207 RepID=A0ACB6RWV6_9PLEO|nr:glycoside hydrolase family 5 protein [Macroventuria anomochaeta]KAF2626268.1 glycoside hydrolase family 5 protein [Macroventuria anomochaeta]